MGEPDILNLLQNKDALIKYLIGIIISSDKNTAGLNGMKERGCSTEFMLEKVIQVTAIQSQQLKHLALVALILAKSSKFDIIIAEIMLEMGRGDEALRAMMEMKLGKK